MRSNDRRRKGDEWTEESEGGSKHSGDFAVPMSSIDFAARDNHRVRRMLASCDK
jgi:hypothetical protein